MAEFISLYSGSSGNSSVVRCGAQYLIVDMGKGVRTTTAALKSLGLAVSDCAGILVTHEHSDHNQVSRVHLKPDGKVLRAANLIDGASYGGCLVKDVLVKATAAYNKNHPKSECVGFLISTGGKKLYFACDTSETEEMRKLRAEQIDYAFLPIDGIYNMNAIEAARCAEIIGPKCNVPVHMKPGALFSQEMAESFHAENRLILRPGQTITW